MIKRICLFTLLLPVFAAVQAQTTTVDSTIYVAVSKEYSSYVKWLKTVNPKVKVINLYRSDTAAAALALDTCHAVLLTGGEDVYPGRYGKLEDTSRCGRFDLKRDTLEFFLVSKALSRQMPLLGICRGEQLLNVALGGTLYIDIPEDLGDKEKHRAHSGGDIRHPVAPVPGSFLHKITGAESEAVASNHHQGVEKLAPGLKAAAHTHDGLVEAVERAGDDNPGFLLGVQWHPERTSFDSKLSLPIAEAFMKAAFEYREAKK